MDFSWGRREWKVIHSRMDLIDDKKKMLLVFKEGEPVALGFQI